jgi:replicative DNA helicase
VNAPIKTDNARPMPHSRDAERSVIGSILIDPDALDVVTEPPVSLEAEDFHGGAHRRIFAAILALSAKSSIVDELTVADWLRERGELETVGGVAAVSALASAMPTSAHVRAYAEIVKNNALRRRQIAIGHGLVEAAHGEVPDVRAMIDAAQTSVLSLGEQAAVTSEEIKDTMKRVFSTMERAANSPDSVKGLSFGLEEVDRLSTGMHPGDLHVIAGRPGHGKSVFAMTAVEATCITRPGVAQVFSLEMSSDQLTQRLLSGLSRVPLERIRSGKLGPQDWLPMSMAAGRIAQAHIMIDARSGLTVPEMRATCRRTRRKWGRLDLIVIDYLQLMHIPQRSHGSNLADDIGDVTRQCKTTAKDFECPLMLLSQLNRSLENRTDKRPVASDLRSSGAIEQDADAITFLYRDELYNKETADKGIAEIICVKNRMGAPFSTRAAFLGHLTRFENLADDGITVSTQSSLRLPRPSGGGTFNPDDAERER